MQKLNKKEKEGKEIWEILIQKALMKKHLSIQ